MSFVRKKLNKSCKIQKLLVGGIKFAPFGSIFRFLLSKMFFLEIVILIKKKTVQ
uniref:Uncharacterized protein n=1 Tax=Manihot esculenta TaxID=3983 RepID=A0A2C9V9W5_MANES